MHLAGLACLDVLVNHSKHAWPGVAALDFAPGPFAPSVPRFLMQFIEDLLLYC
jgi:hypothetical protein